VNVRTVVLVDTGPLVALVDEDDQGHQSCSEFLDNLPGSSKLVTIYPVLTEAFYLIGKQNELSNLFQILTRIEILLRSGEDMDRIQTLMERYGDLPMDFADAALVATAEALNIKTVFTLDQRDFRVYRPKHCGHFEVVP
jgi:hypothetical protein